MSATVGADFVFTPKVWQDHVRAYFDKKLVYGSVALRNDDLKPDAGKGDTVSFPYFKAIGAAEEPAESSGLQVDKLQDDSFTCQVKEVGKAVGIKKKAFKVSAARTATIIDEIQRQIGRVHAEKVDADLLTEMSTSGNYVDGFTATLNSDKMTVRVLNQAKTVGFGDKADQSIVCFMHSLQFMDLLNDTTAGFLQANALDPMAMVEGFKGRLLGMAIVVADTIPNNGGAQIASKAAYNAFIHKMNPYGIIIKQDMEMESDYDILQREWVFTGNEWYGVKSFHGKVASLDKRTCRLTTVTG
jgi:hypothetical protein